MYFSSCVTMCFVLLLSNVAWNQDSQSQNNDKCSLFCFNKTKDLILRYRAVINNRLTDFSEFLPTENEAIEDMDIGELSFSEMMLNHTLKVAVTFTPMESIFKAQLSNGSMVNIYGSSNVAYGYLLDLQEIFRFRIKIVPSIGWITEGVNGALTGVGAQVHFGQADIGLDLSKPVIYRARHLTFLHAIKQDRVAIMFRQPQVQIYRNILARPFKDGLWKRVLQSFFAIILSTVIISRRKDIQSILLPIVGALLARSVYMAGILNCSSRSLHIVIFVTSLFGLTMYSIYSAFIVSSLRRYVAPVKSFQDLIDYNYELMAQRSLPDFTNVFLNDPRDGKKYARIAKKNFINEKNSLRRLFYPVIENVTTADDENHEDSAGVAWFVLKSDFYYVALENNYTTKQICEISKLEPTSRPEHPRLLAMFIAKNAKNNNSSFPTGGSINGMKEHFNRRILDIMARGLGHRHITRYESEFQPNCLRRRRVQIQQIRYYDVYYAYRVLGFGASFALIIMIVLECLIHNWLQFRESRYQIIEENSRVVYIRSEVIEMENQNPVCTGTRILW